MIPTCATCRLYDPTDDRRGYCQRMPCNVVVCAIGYCTGWESKPEPDGAAAPNHTPPPAVTEPDPPAGEPEPKKRGWPKGKPRKPRADGD